ncbi:MAG: DoxX family protein [Gloeobacteraceae cyanobacterium ES-bin-316]|nr:DoxX family protein [Ferruginibacter sp.]
MSFNLKNIMGLLLRVLAAVILFQTLYFKFTGHPESVELFTKLGVEPWGRIGTGIIELVTSILLLVPATVFIGAFLGIGLMSGAILSHLTAIGIESKGDGGQLFMLAIIVWVCCAIIMILYKHRGIELIKKFRKGKSNLSVN